MDGICRRKIGVALLGGGGSGWRGLCLDSKLPKSQIHGEVRMGFDDQAKPLKIHYSECMGADYSLTHVSFTFTIGPRQPLFSFFSQTRLILKSQKSCTETKFT